MAGDTTMREVLGHVEAAVRVLEAAADEQQGRPLELSHEGLVTALTARQLSKRVADELHAAFYGRALSKGG